VLLGPSSATLAPTLRWGLRESKFLGWIILLAVIFLVARLLLLRWFQGISGDQTVFRIRNLPIRLRTDRSVHRLAACQ